MPYGNAHSFPHIKVPVTVEDESLIMIPLLCSSVPVEKHTFDTSNEYVTINRTVRNNNIEYSAWFSDGSESLHLSKIWKNKGILPEWLREKMSCSLDGENFTTVKSVIAYLADTEQMVCAECSCLFDRENRCSRGFAGTICRSCHVDSVTCPESDDGSHDDKCLNPSQKRNARLPTRYKCQECGRTRATTPTG